jgi:hypothetical protein
VARNSAGEISSTLHLSIKHELEAFVSPEIQTVDVGQRAAFTCKLMPHNSAHLESGMDKFDQLMFQIQTKGENLTRKNNTG